MRSAARVQRWAAALLALVLSATAAPRSEAGDPREAWPEDVRGWVEELSSADASVRDRAVDLLGTSAGSVAVPFLRERLSGSSAGLNADGLDASGAVVAMHGVRAGYVHLIKRADDARPSVLRWLKRAAREAEFFVDDDMVIVGPGAFVGEPALPKAPEPKPDPMLGWWRWLARATDESLAAPRDGSGNGWGSKDPDWLDYLQAVWVLQEEGNRRSAARLFAAMAARYPKSPNAAGAKELAGVLDGMVREDADFRAPAKPAALSTAERIAWLIYRLRDVVGHQMSQPGRTSVLYSWSRPPDGHPGEELAALGDAALPAVAALLEDRRATRCVGYWRNFHPSRTILRYQDAAVEILGRILPFAPYWPLGTASYFSEEAPEKRARVREKVSRWIEESKGKDPIERQFLAASFARLPDTIEILHRLATRGGQKDRVLRELARLYDEPRRRAWRPEICEAMCELDDRSHLAEVLGGAPAKEPMPTCEDFTDPDPEDGARFLNGHETVQRLRAKYGGPPGTGEPAMR